ncbi:hypothetical protein RISK_000376 [Rhodopirellula islandica]|uniref:Uncharacterized protein n=1 Tax=Rhodopirellula islandica TaxID=595434 RepID=A0A0J1BLH5_RHOIS|nr:hypothetical protein RISK_000376 [Rhodopirellula islandica]
MVLIAKGKLTIAKCKIADSGNLLPASQQFEIYNCQFHFFNALVVPRSRVRVAK